MASTSRSDLSRADAKADPVELAAANWLLARESGLSPEREREFARWLRADERHARIYAKIEQTWTLLDRVPAGALPLPRRRRPARAWAASALAAAAAIAIAFTATNRLRPAPALLARSAVTPIGGFQEIPLPDGSVVRLNTASEVEFAFTAGERQVHLKRGEASFAVAKDSARPFVVRTGPVQVRAVGTAFNVRRNIDAVEILVTEGRVRVDGAAATAGASGATSSFVDPERAGLPGDSRVPDRSHRDRENPLLGAGQRATIPVADTAAGAIRVRSITPEEVARILAWQNRRLEFSAESLENVVAEFNRYCRQRLVIADPRLRTRLFGGKFSSEDAESFVRLLEENFGVIAEHREHETVLRLKP